MKKWEIIINLFSQHLNCAINYSFSYLQCKNEQTVLGWLLNHFWEIWHYFWEKELVILFSWNFTAWMLNNNGTGHGIKVDQLVVQEKYNSKKEREKMKTHSFTAK